MNRKDKRKKSMEDSYTIFGTMLLLMFLILLTIVGTEFYNYHTVYKTTTESIINIK